MCNKQYLKIENYNGYDNYYIDISKDKTWKTIMYHLEVALDIKYLDNDENLTGIKLSLEIVDTVPEGVVLDGEL